MNTQGGSGLQLPANEQTRSVVLSYLIHHGHKDTARAFMTEMARREATESIEKCPLWTNTRQDSGSDSSMEIVDNVVSPALDHALPGTDNQTAALTTKAMGKEIGQMKARVRGISESALEDVGIRHIRNAIISGKIDDAIDRITHHLPTFLPIVTPDASVLSPVSNSHSSSHDPSQTTTNLLSLAPLASPPSRITTPIEPIHEPKQPSEKTIQKTDVPAAPISQTGSPKQAEPQDVLTPDRAPHKNANTSLGRSVNPAHMLLNLRVQQFLEAVRTVPLEADVREQSYDFVRQDELIDGEESRADVSMHSPGSPTDRDRSDNLQEAHDATTLSTSGPVHSVARQQYLFELASQLYQSAQGLEYPRDREIYANEVEKVCSLMIGPSPENSSASPYLSMDRREALADQVNSSMLHYVGESPAPALQIWAQTTKVVWDQIRDQIRSSQLMLPRGADIPADVKMYAHYVVRSTEGEDERSQTVKAVGFDFAGLARA